MKQIFSDLHSWHWSLCPVIWIFQIFISTDAHLTEERFSNSSRYLKLLTKLFFQKNQHGNFTQDFKNSFLFSVFLYILVLFQGYMGFFNTGKAAEVQHMPLVSPSAMFTNEKQGSVISAAPVGGGEGRQDVSVGKWKNSATATPEHVFYRVMPIFAEKHHRFVLSIVRNSVEYSSGASQV